MKTICQDCNDTVREGDDVPEGFELCQKCTTKRFWKDVEDAAKEFLKWPSWKIDQIEAEKHKSKIKINDVAVITKSGNPVPINTVGFIDDINEEYARFNALKDDGTLSGGGAIKISDLEVTTAPYAISLYNKYLITHQKLVDEALAYSAKRKAQDEKEFTQISEAISLPVDKVREVIDAYFKVHQEY